MIVELLQLMQAGQEISFFKLNKIQNSWYFRTLWDNIRGCSQAFLKNIVIS